MSVHDVGDVVTLWAVFRNALDAQTAPTTVTLTVRTPDGESTEVANAVAQAGDKALAEAATSQTLSGVTGVYKADVSIDQAGIWVYRWAGTGAVAEVEPGVIYVRPDPIGEEEGS